MLDRELWWKACGVDLTKEWHLITSKKEVSTGREGKLTVHFPGVQPLSLHIPLLLAVLAHHVPPIGSARTLNIHSCFSSSVLMFFLCSDTDWLLQGPKIRVNAREAVRPQDLYRRT